MAVASKHYAVVEGYALPGPFKGTDGTIVGWDFRFTVFLESGGTLAAVVGEGITVDEVAETWTLDFPIPIGDHRYSHDYKPAGAGWRQASTGDLRITDPRADQ